MNLHEIHIPIDFPPERADKLLARLLPGMPGWQLRAAFGQKDIKRDGKRITPQTVLSPGDVVHVYTPYAKDMRIECVHQDGEYAVLHKMPGLEVQGAVSLETIASEQLCVPLRACHRLDVQTGGLVLFAKSDAALQKARQAFATHDVSRTYRALVRGLPTPPEATLHAFLLKDASASTVHITKRHTPGALPIETRYRVMEPGEAVSRVEVQLMTGRTHQIRAHMAFIGHPVIGDDKYGDRECNRQQGARRQMLWAVKLTLWDGRSFEVREGF